MSYSAEVLADSPTIYWRLDETSGTTATDASGGGLDGTYQNTPTLGVAGAVDDGTAITVAPASSEYVNRASVTGLASSSFSVELWMKKRVAGLGACGVVQHGPSSSDYNIFYFVWQSATQVRAGLWAAGSDVTVTVTDDALWHHYVVTYNVATNALLIYRDGTNIASGTPGSDYVGGSSFLQVGTATDTGFGYFDGSLDEFALYLSVLSPTRVLAHYSAASVPSVMGRAFNPIPFL